MGAIISKLLGIHNVRKDDTIIAVIGEIGSGKSTFINTAAGKEVLKAARKVQYVACTHPEYGRGGVVFVDTPALDSELDETAIERKLGRWLWKVSSLKRFKISGILYLHKITESGLFDPPVNRLRWLQKLCDKSSQGRVMLVTTLCEKLKSREVRLAREEELRERWLLSGYNATQIMSFDNSPNGAWDIVFTLMGTAVMSRDYYGATTHGSVRTPPETGIVQAHDRNEINKGRILDAQGQNQQFPSPLVSVPDHRSPPESHPQPRIALENHSPERNQRTDPPRLLDTLRTKDTLHQIPLEDRENPTSTSNPTVDSNTFTVEALPGRISNLPKTTNDLEAPPRQAVVHDVATAQFQGHVSHDPLDEDRNNPGSGVTSQAGRVSKARLLKVVEMILEDKECYRAFLSTTGELAQQMLDTIQKLIDYTENPATRRELLMALMRLSAQSGLYPRCLVLRQVQHDSQPVAAGQFGEIRKGTFGGEHVSLKVVKLYQQGQIEHLLKNYAKEAIIWSDLHHPNLLPFYGVYHLDDSYGRICLVSPWMDNGNVREHLKAHPTHPRMPLVHDVIKGLSYLHRKQIVHGDLKGVNILVTSSGRACLADFGLSSVMDGDILKWTSLETMTQTGGTVRWLAPELMDDPGDGKLSPRANYASDMFSMSSVIYEILSGQTPFYELSREVTVISKVVRGVRPSRPSPEAAPELTDRVWEIMQLCWLQKPEERPSILEIAEKFLPTKELREEDLGEEPPENLHRTLTFRQVMHGVDGDTVPASDMEMFMRLVSS